MIQKFLLNTQMIWMIFIKILKNKNIIQIKNEKYYLYFMDYLYFTRIADMLSNKKLNPIVTELFIKGRKLDVSLVFITQSYFAVPKDIRLNLRHDFVMKIPNKRELHQTALNHSSDIDFQDFLNLYKNCISKAYSFFVIDTTLESDSSSRFKNFY